MLRSLLLIGVLASGCYSEEADVAYGGNAYGPDLVQVSPGVDVIADYDYPVFYSDGFYWRYDDGLWYRSGYWNRGWGVAYNVPYGVRGIRDPGGYSHWHGNGGAIVRDHRTGYTARGGYGGGAVVRDHRSYGGGGGAVRSAPRATSFARPSGGARGGGGGFHGGGHGGRR